eukprot:1538934-Amphidinium_carterae.1
MALRERKVSFMLRAAKCILLKNDIPAADLFLSTRDCVLYVRKYPISCPATMMTHDSSSVCLVTRLPRSWSWRRLQGAGSNFYKIYRATPVTVVVCHITAERDRSWWAMATLLVDFLDKVHNPCVTVGDFSVLTDPGDVLGWCAQTCLSQRCHSPLDFRTQVSSTQRTLDRFYLNADKSVCIPQASNLLVALHRTYTSIPTGSPHSWLASHWCCVVLEGDSPNAN